MLAQRFAHAGSEPVVLNEDSHQLLDFGFAIALGEIAQGIGTAFAGAHFQGDERHIFAQLGMADGQFARDVLNGLIEPQPGRAFTVVAL